MFSMITEIPILKTSDSDSAFSISDSELIIGVIAIFTISLNSGFSHVVLIFDQDLNIRSS